MFINLCHLKLGSKGLITSVVVTALVKEITSWKRIWFLKPQNKTQVAGTIRVQNWAVYYKAAVSFSAVSQVTHWGAEAMRGAEETWVFGQNGSRLFSFLSLFWLNGRKVSKRTPPSLSIISHEERDRGEVDRCSRKHQIVEGLLISVLAFLVNNEHARA